MQGGACQEEVARRGEGYTPDDQFVREFCPELVRGLAALTAWVTTITGAAC
jgi:hypothetical protein